MLRKISLVLNSLVVVVSVALFCYTFLAKSHLESQAQRFLVEKTLHYSKPVIDLTKSGLNDPIASKLLSPNRKAEIKAEILAYENNPVEYIRGLTGAGGKRFEGGKVAEFKNKVVDYYYSVFDELVQDLRIFSVSNIVAGLFCLFLILHPKSKKNSKVMVFSIVVFVAVAFSSYGYIEGLSFFRILFKWNLGWWYPVGIVFTVIGLYIDYGREIKSLEKIRD